MVTEYRTEQKKEQASKSLSGKVGKVVDKLEDISNGLDSITILIADTRSGVAATKEKGREKELGALKELLDKLTVQIEHIDTRMYTSLSLSSNFNLPVLGVGGRNENAERNSILLQRTVSRTIDLVTKMNEVLVNGKKRGVLKDFSEQDIKKLDEALEKVKESMAAVFSPDAQKTEAARERIAAAKLASGRTGHLRS